MDAVGRDADPDERRLHGVEHGGGAAGEVLEPPEPGGQVAGRRTGSVFIENGRFHGQQIAGVLAERFGVTA